MKKLFLLIVLVALTMGLLFYRQRPSKKISRIFKSAACEKFYRDLFRNPVVKIRVVFGYKDARPARFVADRYEKALFVQKLTAPCREKNFDCEFKLERDDDANELYTKSVSGIDGETVKILLQVYNSSVSPDDEVNRRDPFQKWQSNYARDAFEEGLIRSDVVFYNGHSRLGGGPDFDFPLLDADQHVNYKIYQQKKIGLQLVLKSLAHSNDLKALGLFSCSSNQHFAKLIRKTKPGLQLFTSDKPVYFSDAIEQSLSSLSSLLQMKCNML